MAQSPIHVTLSNEIIVEFVRRKVASGEYASESDVVLEGLQAFKQESDERERWEQDVPAPSHDSMTASSGDAELERWLKEVGGPRIDSFNANPSSGIPIDEVERHLAERRRARAERV